MANQNDQAKQLAEDIRLLKREIARLSALLALKKMESDHPALQKLAEEVDRAGQSLASGRDKIAEIAVRYLPEGRSEAARFASHVLILSAIGFIFAWLFGWLGEDRR